MERIRSAVAAVQSFSRRALERVAANATLALVGLSAAVLLVSLAIYALAGTEQVRRVLFFPDPESHRLVGEEHFVPRVRGTEESVRLLVKELLLGPASFELSPLLPKSANLRSVSLRDRVLYVDFSTDLVLDLATVPLGLGQIIQGVANNAYFNFPRLRGVYVFVHGQVPRVEDVDASKLAYSRQVVR